MRSEILNYGFLNIMIIFSHHKKHKLSSREKVSTYFPLQLEAGLTALNTFAGQAQEEMLSARTSPKFYQNHLDVSHLSIPPT